MTDSALTLDARPFTSTPFVKHYFPSQSIECSLGSASRCIERGAGPVVVIGAAGTGKSLLMMKLEEEFQSQFSVAHLSCARLDDRHELLQSILFELQLPYKNLSEGELRLSLMDHLKRSQQCPNGVLLLVDEAQNLTVELLDEVRLITNLVRDGQPRVRLVLTGNGRLEDRLNDPKLASLNQRIAARCYLDSLSQSETADYVVTHLDRFGGNGKAMFPTASLRAIHELSEGCPRFINQICDHALAIGFENRAAQIDEATIRRAWAEVQCLPCSETTSSSSSPSGIASDSGASLSKNSVIEFGSLDDETMLPSDDGNEAQAFTSPSSFEEPSTNRSKKSWTEAATPEPELLESANDGFDNPFSEIFAQEENVIDQYLPLVADRNRKSLDVTSVDLASLQPLDIPCDEVAPVSCGTDLEPNLATTFSVTSHDEDDSCVADCENECDDNCHQSHESNFAFDANELDSHECDSQKATCEANCESDGQQAGERPIADCDDYESAEFVPAIVGQHASHSDDDRDLLMVNRAEPHRFAAKSKRDNSIPFPVTAVSTGGAVRMDYQQLFEQLRTIPE